MSRRATNVRREPPSKPVLPNWLIIVVVAVVLGMWVGTTIYSTQNPDWPIPPSVHAGASALFLGIGGYFATTGRRRDNGA